MWLPTKMGFLKPLGLTAIMLCTLLVAGCGFQLRTASNLPEDLQSLIVTANDNDSALYHQLLRQLEFANITPADEATANAELKLLSDSLDRRTLSLFQNGQVAEYELIYTVKYELSRNLQEPVKRRFEITRNYQDDPNNALAKSKEMNLILSEMRLQASRQIIRELSQL